MVIFFEKLICELKFVGVLAVKLKEDEKKDDSTEETSDV